MINYEFKEFNSASFRILITMGWAKVKNLKYLDFRFLQLFQVEKPLTHSSNVIRFKEQFSANGMLSIPLRKNLE